jgi:hypothetical protein
MTTTSLTRISKCLVAGESPLRPQLALSHGPQAHRVSLPSCKGCGPISIALDKENEEVCHENEPRLKLWLVFAFHIFPAPPLMIQGPPFSCQPTFEQHKDAASPIPTSQMTRVNGGLTTDMSLQQMQTRSSNNTTREQSRMALHWFYVLSIIQCTYT